MRSNVEVQCLDWTEVLSQDQRLLFSCAKPRPRGLRKRCAILDHTIKEMIDFGSVDAISAGAVTHAFFSALARIPKSRGEFRVIEPQTSDLSNLNRYELLEKQRQREE